MFLSLTFGVDVIYQVHTLLKGLEKIAASADIPMLVAGDFNSLPGRLVVVFWPCLDIWSLEIVKMSTQWYLSSNNVWSSWQCTALSLGKRSCGCQPSRLASRPTQYFAACKQASSFIAFGEYFCCYLSSLLSCTSFWRGHFMPWSLHYVGNP